MWKILILGLLVLNIGMPENSLLGENSKTNFNNNIQSKVVDTEGAGIPRVQISTGKSSVFTDAQGYFRIVAISDSVRFSKAGFRDLLLNTADVKEEIILLRQPYELSPVQVIGKVTDSFFSSGDIQIVRTDPDRVYGSASEMVGIAGGISSSGLSLSGERKTLSILGNLSRHTLVLIDGIPVGTPGEAFDLSSILPENIERIEVIKNNASVYGGSSAIGGIVHIHTKQGITKSKMINNYRLETGSFSYLKNSYEFDQTVSNRRLRVSLSAELAKNDFSYRLPDWWDNETRIRDNNEKSSYQFSTGISSLLKNALMSYNFDFERIRRELPGPVNFLDLYRKAFLTGQSFRQNLRLEGERYGLTYQLLAWLNDDMNVYDNTQTEFQQVLTKNSQQVVTKGLRAILSKQIGAYEQSFNVELKHLDFESKNILYPAQDFTVNSSSQALAFKTAYLIDNNNINGNLAILGRYDIHDEKGFSTYRTEAYIKYLSYLDYGLGATLGTSYSLPSYNDLYWRGDSQAMGNPDLEPETSKGYQIWGDISNHWLQTKISYHRNEVRDLIYWRQVYLNGTHWKPFNLGKARIENVEAELVLHPELGLGSALPLKLSYSTVLTRARDISDALKKPDLIYTPRLKSNLRADYNNAFLISWLAMSLTGKQYSTPDNLIDPIDSFLSIDCGFGLKHHIGKTNIGLSLNVYNLLDRTYEVYAYVPHPGRNWKLVINLSR